MQFLFPLPKMIWLLDKLFSSGTNTHCHLTADNERELLDAARRLKVPVKNGKHDRQPHLDLNEHKRNLALRYGAKENDND